MGEPGSPIPLGRAAPSPSRGQGDGETGFPHTPALAAIRCNEGDYPLPDPPPLGEGTRLLPPAGGGWEGGSTLRTMVTAAVHAAPPHTNRMNIGSSWEGCALPNPPTGWGDGGNPVSPHPSPRAYVHVRTLRHGSNARDNLPRHGTTGEVVEGPGPSTPPRQTVKRKPLVCGGAAWTPDVNIGLRREVRGNRVAPDPRPRERVGGRHPAPARASGPRHPAPVPMRDVGGAR